MPETYEERKFWNPKIQTMARDEIRELQERKLRRQLVYAYENTPFYRELYDKEKVDVYKIKTIEDFQKYVPIINKDGVRGYRERTGDPFGGVLALNVPRRKLYQMGRSSGTTGIPTIAAMALHDYENYVEDYARWVYGCGIREGDSLLLQGYWWNIVGHAVRDGSMKVGATVLNLEGYPMEARTNLELLFLFKPTATFVTSIPLHEETRIIVGEGINAKERNPNLKFIWQGGDILVPPTVEYFEKAWGVPIYDYAGSTEPLFQIGCCAADPINHHHMWEDHYFVEVVDPATKEAVGEEQRGEFVVTPLDREAMPYIRFFTDDVASITHAKCPCGSTHMRFSYHGREDWGVNVKGIPTTVFPPDIEAVIYRHREVFGQPWQIVKFKEQPQDKLVVRVSCDPKITRDEKGLARRLGEDLGKEFKVDTEIEMVKAEEIAASAYKYVKVFKR